MCERVSMSENTGTSGLSEACKGWSGHQANNRCAVVKRVFPVFHLII